MQIDWQFISAIGVMWLASSFILGILVGKAIRLADDHNDEMWRREINPMRGHNWRMAHGHAPVTTFKA